VFAGWGAVATARSLGYGLGNPALASSTEARGPSIADTPQQCPAGLQPAPDGLIDDFEDDNAQVAAMAGRDGFRWLSKAEHASFTLPEGPLLTSEGGPLGSKRAIHLVGKTDSADDWGAGFGMELLAVGFYDASKYAGISFQLKGGEKLTPIRFEISDVNTNPEGGRCKDSCYNEFGKAILPTADWKDIELSFAELRQQDGWGSPRPEALSTRQVKYLKWSVDKGVEFDFWIDQVRLLKCK
jgi:hypothetical protein